MIYIDCQVFRTLKKFHHKINNTFSSQICHQTSRIALSHLKRSREIEILCCTIDYYYSIACHLILTAMSTKFNELKAILSRHYQLIYVTLIKRNEIEAYGLFFCSFLSPSLNVRYDEWKKHNLFTYLVIKQKAHLCFSCATSFLICIAKTK